MAVSRWFSVGKRSRARLSTKAVRLLRTLGPERPQEDLAWLDEAIGDARVVAIGENAHSNRESYQLCHRLTRYLVEQHGFGAYAMESGFVEGWPADDWVSGGQGRPGHVLANGMTSLMGRVPSCEPLWNGCGNTTLMPRCRPTAAP